MRKLKALLTATVMAVGGMLFTAAPAQAATGVWGVWNYNDGSQPARNLGIIHLWPNAKNYDVAMGNNGISTYYWSRTGGIYLGPHICAQRWTYKGTGPADYPPNIRSRWTRAGADFNGGSGGRKFQLSGDYWVIIVQYAC